jgi:hypothetical protein
MRSGDIVHVTAVSTKPPDNQTKNQFPTADQKRRVAPARFQSNRPKHIQLSSFRSSNQGIRSFCHWARDVAIGVQANEEAMYFFQRR